MKLKKGLFWKKEKVTQMKDGLWGLAFSMPLDIILGVFFKCGLRCN